MINARGNGDGLVKLNTFLIGALDEGSIHLVRCSSYSRWNSVPDT